MKTKKELVAIAKSHGCSSLLSVNADSKTVKGLKKGYLTAVLYMMPNDNLCPVAKVAGCREGCLVSAGRAAFTPGIGMSRAGRTSFFENDRDAFMELLVRFEIPAVIRKAKREGMTPAIRLNGTSDVNWSNVCWQGKSVFEHFPEVQFYDYTKSPAIIRAAAGETNWHVTASYSEASDQYSFMIQAAASKYGANLAVVFRTKDLPETFLGRKVVNGDETDLRFLDEKGVIIGLKAKGKAKHDTSGFVIDTRKATSPAKRPIIIAVA